MCTIRVLLRAPFTSSQETRIETSFAKLSMRCGPSRFLATLLQNIDRSLILLLLLLFGFQYFFKAIFCGYVAEQDRRDTLMFLPKTMEEGDLSILLDYWEEVGQDCAVQLRSRLSTFLYDRLGFVDNQRWKNAVARVCLILHSNHILVWASSLDAMCGGFYAAVFMDENRKVDLPLVLLPSAITAERSCIVNGLFYSILLHFTIFDSFLFFVPSYSIPQCFAILCYALLCYAMFAFQFHSNHIRQETRIDRASDF